MTKIYDKEISKFVEDALHLYMSGVIDSAFKGEIPNSRYNELAAAKFLCSCGLEITRNAVTFNLWKQSNGQYKQELIVTVTPAKFPVGAIKLGGRNVRIKIESAGSYTGQLEAAQRCSLLFNRLSQRVKIPAVA